MLWWKALVLGVVEGVTEFLPISSTGHLILVSALVDYPESQRTTFDVFIQIGAILAVVWLYRGHLWSLLTRAPQEARARSLLAKVLLAFLPAAAVGFFFHMWIESYLFAPHVVAYALIGGGIVLLWVDRRTHPNLVQDIENLTWTQALWIGLAQTLSLIPGVSRAAATIVGGLLSGLSRPVATQFSFYLSIPTLGAASAYSLIQARHNLALDDVVALSLGFVTAFASAAIVVEGFVRFVQRHTFLVFALYRIVLGLVVLLYLV
ncbi:Undecaprenyl-diphosphatase [bacterium HR30]|nr:Undecaprenyl-diphosphatase [bacterium HR30]